MKRHTILKILIPALFALAVALGLLQRSQDPYLGYQKTTLNFHSSTPGEKSLADYYQESSDLAKQAKTSNTVEFLAVGDIMLSRNVAGKIKEANNPLLPFSKMADILKSVNFTFGNLESPFYFEKKNSVDKNAGIIGGHSLIFGSPVANAQGLSEYNFKALSLANNHALDQGPAGLTATKKLLTDLGLHGFGAGANLDEAWQPAEVSAGGLKICFLTASYASNNDGGKTKNNYVARMEDLENLKSSILNLKSQCDFIIAAMHAGTEYTNKPNQAQVAFAHAAINYGADMVIGSHPHWVQTIEKYCPNSNEHPPLTPPIEGGETADSLPLVGRVREGEQACLNPKYIFYSLGNFVFDQEWSQDTKEGLALKIQITKASLQNPLAPKAAVSDDLQGTRIPAKLEQIELIPVILEDYSTPRPATAEESKKILEKIGQTENIIRP